MADIVCANCGQHFEKYNVLLFRPFCGWRAGEPYPPPFSSVRLRCETFETMDPLTHERGGGGCTTSYIASERKVIHKSWYYNPTDKTHQNNEEELFIPDCISTDEEFREYLLEHRPLFLAR